MPTLCERKKDISIIIPCYNLEDYIGRMIASLAAQDYGDYTHEIMFVLNNCTDKTEDIIRTSGLDYRILYCTTQGCGPARNTGLEASTGKYIWMVDGDDWLLEPTAVRDVLDRAGGRHNIIYIPFRSDTYRYQYFSMVPQYLLKWEFIGDIRFPNYQPAEDDAFMQQILAKAGYNRYNYLTLPKVNRPLYYYNYGRPGSNMMRYYAGEKI